MPELLRGVHTIEGVTMNLAGAPLAVYPSLIIEPTGLTLIDAGPVGSEGPIRDYVQRLGYGVQDIERILVTHHHPDHAGSVARLAEMSGAVVAAHVNEIPMLEHRVPAPAQPLTPEGLAAIGIDLGTSKYAVEREWEAGFVPPTIHVTEELRGGDILPILGGLVVLHDPGHSPGHVAFFAPSYGVLFASDLFYNDGVDIQVPLPIFTQDAGAAKETLRAIVETCDFETAIPYHGVPICQGAAEALSRAISAVPVGV